MRTRTLSAMCDDAYKAADMEGFTERYPVAEVTRYINQGVAELWDLLVAAKGYAYFGRPYYKLSTTSTTLSAGAITLSGTVVTGTTATVDVRIKVTVSGALGTSAVQYSLDGGTTYNGTDITLNAVTILSDSGLIANATSATYQGHSGQVVTVSAYNPVTVADTTSYRLPDDFYKLHQAYLINGSSPMQLLDRLGFVEDAPSRYGYFATTGGYPGSYDLRSNFIDILPAPSGAWTLKIWYVPKATTLTNADDAFDGINGWEDYPVAYAAKKILNKEADFEMANMVQQDLNKLRERIQVMSKDRDYGRAQQVQDIRGALSHRSRLRRLR